MHFPPKFLQKNLPLLGLLFPWCICSIVYGVDACGLTVVQIARIINEKIARGNSLLELRFQLM